MPTWSARNDGAKGWLTGVISRQPVGISTNFRRSRCREVSNVTRVMPSPPGWLQDVAAELRLPPSPDQGRRRLTRRTRSSHGHQGCQLSDFDANSERWIAAPETALLGRAAKAPAVAASARGDGRLVLRWGERLERATRGAPRCPLERQRTRAPGRGFPGHAFAGTLHLEQYSERLPPSRETMWNPSGRNSTYAVSSPKPDWPPVRDSFAKPVLPQEGHFNFTEKQSRAVIPAISHWNRPGSNPVCAAATGYRAQTAPPLLVEKGRS